MKRIVKIVLALFALAFVGYWSYKYVKNTASILGVIHKDAKGVVKVGVNSISETLVLDALGAPNYYYKNSSFKSSNSKKDTVKDAGVNLRPFNIIGFTMPKIKNTIFSVFKIDNAANFKEYAQLYAVENNLAIKASSEGVYQFVEIKKKGAICAWNSKKLIIAIATNVNLKKVEPVFSDVLLNNKVIEEKENYWIKTLLDSKDHLAFFTKKGKVAVNFKDGEASIEGAFKSKNQFPEEVSLEIINNAALSTHLNLDFTNSEVKNTVTSFCESIQFFKKADINAAKFVNRTDGSLYFAMAGNTIQNDSIITYTYDDNFNKVEQATVEEKIVPKLYLNFGQTEESLYEYLENQKAISNRMFTALPFYKIYTHEEGLYTTFKTEPKQKVSNKIVSPYFFDFKADFKKLEENSSISHISQYLKLLENMRFTAKQNSDEILVKGNITGYNSNVNIVSQIVFGLEAIKNQEPSTIK